MRSFLHRRSPCPPGLAVAALLALVSLGSAACEGAFETSDGTVHFHPLEPGEKLVEPISDPGPPVVLEGNKAYQDIIKGFRENVVRLFAQPDIGTRLDQIERVYLQTGRYLELVALYQRAYEAHGLDSVAASRLAWGLIRIGQRQRARSLLDKLIEARPDDATVAFVEGAFWVDKTRRSPKAAAKVAVAWNRALKLDPDFRGFEGIPAESIRRQVSRIESRLPDKPAALLEEPLFAKAGDSPGGESAKDAKAEAADAPTDTGSETPATDDAARDDAKTNDGTTDNGTTDSQPVAQTGGGAPEKPDTDAPDEQGPPPVGALLTKADIAASSGDLQRAATLYEKVLEQAPDRLDAKLGALKVALRQSDSSPDAQAKLREWLDDDGLTAHLAWEMGLLARSRLESPDLAEAFFERVSQLDADFAERVGID